MPIMPVERRNFPDSQILRRPIFPVQALSHTLSSRQEGPKPESDRQPATAMVPLLGLLQDGVACRRGGRLPRPLRLASWKLCPTAAPAN